MEQRWVIPAELPHSPACQLVSEGILNHATPYESAQTRRTTQPTHRIMRKNKDCCFKPLSFEVVCYTTKAAKYTPSSIQSVTHSIFEGLVFIN